jgi:RNA polymerase primary sigma factor
MGPVVLDSDVASLSFRRRLAPNCRMIPMRSGTYRSTVGGAPHPEELAERTEFALEKVHQLQRVSRPPVSLDGTVGEDNETRVIDLLEDTSAASPEDVAEQRALTARLEGLVETFAHREAKIISLRFGLADGRPRTLEEAPLAM